MEDFAKPALKKGSSLNVAKAAKVQGWFVEEKFRSVHLKIIGRKMKGNSSQQFFRSWWLLFVIIKCKVFKVKVFKAVSHSSGPVIAMATGVRSTFLTINSTLSEGKTR